MTGLEWAALATGLSLGSLPALQELRRSPMGRTARKNAPGQFVKLSHGQTHYQWLGAGSGPVAVLVHGLTTPSWVWGPLAAELGQHGYRVLVYDLYGRGFSDRPRGPQTPAFFARQLRDLLTHENLHEDITLIGYSMGGVIATHLAAQEDHRFRRLVLLAPAGMDHDLSKAARWAVEWPVLGDWVFHMGFPRQHRRVAALDAAAGSAVENIGTLHLRELAHQGYVRSVLASLRGTLRGQQQDDHRRVAEARLPVSAIWGRLDRTIPIRAMGTLTQWNRNVRHDVLEDADHGLVHTHATRIAQSIADTWQGPVV